jgi:hypothetical protein
VTSAFAGPTAPDDIAAVCAWLKTTEDKLRWASAQESIARFMPDIAVMLDSYSTFPKENRRTMAILKALHRGDVAYPVFVQAGSDFILEGRHRIVAFHLFGMTEVPVVTVSLVDQFT